MMLCKSATSGFDFWRHRRLFFLYNRPLERNIKTDYPMVRPLGCKSLKYKPALTVFLVDQPHLFQSAEGHWEKIPDYCGMSCVAQGKKPMSQMRRRHEECAPLALQLCCTLSTELHFTSTFISSGSLVARQIFISACLWFARLGQQASDDQPWCGATFSEGLPMCLELFSLRRQKATVSGLPQTTSSYQLCVSVLKPI